jgi:hypothetical protein
VEGEHGAWRDREGAVSLGGGGPADTHQTDTRGGKNMSMWHFGQCG